MLEQINKTGDIKSIPEDKLNELASEIRRFLVESVSETGGHLASSLGVVELTMALHRVYDLPKDKIIWDVGHQAYTHKILTGRKDGFSMLRKEGGLSGFPRRSESDSDSFDTGHSSTSISAGVGYANARDIKGDDYSIVSVIGDGALTGGLAYEALNNAARLKSNFVVVLNDNEMSISKNVGGISDYLGRVRTSKAYTALKMNVSGKIGQVPAVGTNVVNAIRKTKSSIKQFFVPGMLFEDMGLTYLGPVDGHNIKQLETVLTEAKNFDGPILVHVITEKGRGYAPARENPTKFHGVSAFKLSDGYKENKKVPTFTNAFSHAIVKIAEKNKDVVAITAAMKEGTGLKRFEKLYKDRFFDVGIAEEHAVTFAAGLSLGGMVPVVAVYSSFLQRAYDQIMMDVCLQNLHVVFAIDRAGFVGEDGKTHQGCFDLSYLSMLPNMTVLAPKDAYEVKKMLDYAVNEATGPVAIRYPKGKLPKYDYKKTAFEVGKAEVVFEGKDLMILAAGSTVEAAAEACDMLKNEGYEPTLVNVRSIKPLDTDLICELARTHNKIITIEENIVNGGFGAEVLKLINDNHINNTLKICAVDDQFVGHGTVAQQRKRFSLDAEGIFTTALSLLNN